MSESNLEQNYVLVDYYKGAYGPTIRIDIQSGLLLLKFKELISVLASGKEKEIRLSEIEFVKLNGIRTFVMKIDSRCNMFDKCLKLISVNHEEKDFWWALNQDGWLNCDGLMEGITGQGHQYLNHMTEGVDDALVELSFKEAL